jgi:hypothetical protein
VVRLGGKAARVLAVAVAVLAALVMVRSLDSVTAPAEGVARAAAAEPAALLLEARRLLERRLLRRRRLAQLGAHLVHRVVQLVDARRAHARLVLSRLQLDGRRLQLGECRAGRGARRARRRLTLRVHVCRRLQLVFRLLALLLRLAPQHLLALELVA